MTPEALTSITLGTIATFLNPLLFALAAFFGARLIKALDKTTEQQMQLSMKLLLLEKDVQSVIEASKTFSQAAKEMSSLREDTGVLKRDQTAIWKRIDEIKLLQEEQKLRIHFAINKITIFKFKADKAGWDMAGEWDVDRYLK